ncbi:MAG: hypothetical protein ACI4IW_00055 [Oscillospiraceae bacterium]
MKYTKIVSALLLFAFLLCSCTEKNDCNNDETLDAKPVIYLYPETMTDVTVTLDYSGRLVCTYPEYNGGWSVTAHPDGTLVIADGNEYAYLFWEGLSSADYDFSEGFVVKGLDTAAFLEEKLSYLGLNFSEREDFITYWLPRMQENPYNLISFQTEAYTESAKLAITPEPDTVIRVFMAFKPLKKPMDIPEQVLAEASRSGFTAVEWGGAEVK